MHWLTYRIRAAGIGLKAVIDGRRPGHRIVMVEESEYTFAVDSTAAAWELRFVHQIERPFYEEVLDEIDADTVFYDIGANMGFYSVLAGSRGARVIAFEPHPKARDLLMRNLELNEILDCHTYQVGLSDEPGEAGLTDPYTFGTTQLDFSGDGIEIETLDTLVERDGVAMPDVVKIDVEGHEESVLRGMDQLLAIDPVLFLEIHQDEEAIIAYLEEHGYEWTEIMDRPDGNTLGRADPAG